MPCPRLQHPQVSILAHPGGRWGKAVRDVRCSASHDAVQQPRPHRCKLPRHQLTFKLRLYCQVLNQHLFPSSSSRPQPRRMWQSPCLQMMVSSLIWHEDLLFLRVKLINIRPAWGGGIQRTGCILEETSCRTAAANTAAWPKLRVTHQVTCLCQVRNPLLTIQEQKRKENVLC